MNQEALIVHHQHVGTVPITDPLLDGMSDALPNILTGTPRIKMGLEGGERKGAFQNATPRERFFHTHVKNVFLGIVVENAPILWLGTEFATPAHFCSRSRAVPKCCSTCAIFSHSCKKIFLVIVVGMPQFDGWESNL